MTDEEKALERLKKQAHEDKRTLCIRLAEYIEDPFGELEVQQAEWILLCIQDLGIADVMKRLNAPEFENNNQPLFKPGEERTIKSGRYLSSPGHMNPPSKEPEEAEDVVSVRSTPGVCGGRPCLGKSRIEVTYVLYFWLTGSKDEAILRQYPGLTQEHLNACRQYLVNNATVSSWPEPPPVRSFLQKKLEQVSFVKHLHSVGIPQVPTPQARALGYTCAVCNPEEEHPDVAFCPNCQGG